MMWLNAHRTAAHDDIIFGLSVCIIYRIFYIGQADDNRSDDSPLPEAVTEFASVK